VHRSSFPGIKQQGRDVDYTSSNYEVKNEWSYTSASLYDFIAWKEKNFTFTFISYTGRRVAWFINIQACPRIH
jgi:hypothetical protein